MVGMSTNGPIAGDVSWPSGPDVTYDVGDPDLKVVQSHTRDAIYTFTLGSPPWDRDEALRASLEAAGWRYAHLINLVGAENEDEERQLSADLVTHNALVRPHNGKPVWREKEATTFVAEQTGVSREVAAAWLNLDWNGGGEV